MSYTLAAAAAAVGLNKTTILRAIKSGKISARMDEHGHWRIEPAELHRVYPPAAGHADSNAAAQREAVFEAVAAAELQFKVALAEQRLAELKADLEDMRSQRNAWQVQAERLALTDGRTQPEQRPHWWWRRRRKAA
jgi:excisionase family DNA binding protein